jgi:nicotinamide riboside kinase
MRVSLSGSYSTGKTTLADACSDRLAARFGGEFTYIHEVARSVIADGFLLDRAATIDSYVVYVGRQLAAERRAATRHVLCDRSLMDLLAYARFNDHSRVPAYVATMLEEIVWRECRYFDVFGFLPIEFPLEDDGVRTPDEEYRANIDRTLRQAFADFGVEPVEIRGSRAEREATLLDLFGVRS